MKTLEGLQWVQMWNSQMGCIRGAVDYLQKDMSTAWLFGGSGYAFVINISDTADESCPTAWQTRSIREMACNIGLKLDGIAARVQDAGEDYPAKQREAWDFVRAQIDRGVPCYGWEVQPYMPEYQVITGYDEVGYYYTGYETGGPSKWEEYGNHDVRHIEVYSVEHCPPANDRKVLRDALHSVLQHTATSRGWAFGDDYTTGPQAYEVWANALESGEAKRDGTSYNALVWHECRKHAVGFMQEARQRLAGQITPACDSALEAVADAYAEARDALEALTVLVPMDMEIWDGFTPLQSPQAAELARKAGVAERRAIDCMKEAVKGL